MSENVKFIRINGRVVPINRKSAPGKTIRAAVLGSKVQKKINKTSSALSSVKKFRSSVPSLKKEYAGTRYASSILDYDDAFAASKMRGLEQTGSLLSKRRSKILKIGASPGGKTLAGVAAVIVGVTAISAALSKRKGK